MGLGPRALDLRGGRPGQVAGVEVRGVLLQGQGHALRVSFSGTLRDSITVAGQSSAGKRRPERRDTSAEDAGVVDAEAADFLAQLIDLCPRLGDHARGLTSLRVPRTGTERVG